MFDRSFFSSEWHRKAIKEDIAGAQSLLNAAEQMFKQGRSVDDKELEAIANALDGLSNLIKMHIKHRKRIAPWEAARIKAWWEARKQNRR